MTDETHLTEYASNIRRLKQSTNTSTSACRVVKYQISDHFPSADAAELQWVQHSSAYEGIVDDSKAAATRLSATINMYTSLQNAFTEAKPGDVIHELATLTKAVSGIDDSYAPRLVALVGAVGEFLRTPDLARFSRRLSGQRSTETSRAGWVGSTSSALQAVGFHLIWTPLVYVGGLLRSRPHMPAARRSMSATSSFSDDPTSPQEVVANIRYLLREFEQQKPQFAVFRQIANELIAEFDQYSRGLEALKDKPDNSDSLGRVHADMASRAGLWKDLARVLVDEYARA